MIWIIYWASAGESTVFEELCPPNYSFISNPRSAGKGGGVAMVFKQTLNVRRVSVKAYSSFEVQCTMLECTSSTLFCALIYRPPNMNSAFISNFSEFITFILPLYDRMLILGDFNVHFCCPGRPFVAEFCNVLDSFGLTQHINQETHVLGHTLDLILSYGTCIDNVNIENASNSDHKPIVFNVPAESSAVLTTPIGYYSRFINSLTASQFSECYLANAVESSILNAAESSSGPDDLITLFYTFCSNILDAIASN